MVSRKLFLLGFALAVAHCASSSSSKEELVPAAKAYNGHIRWKRFTAASKYLPGAERPAFMERYIAAEDNLHIQSIEIRSVDPMTPENPEDPRAAQVTAVAQCYLLPSTVVEKVVMIQRWELRNGNWTIVSSSRELAPELPEEEEPPKAGPELDAPVGGFPEEDPL